MNSTRIILHLIFCWLSILSISGCAVSQVSKASSLENLTLDTWREKVTRSEFSGAVYAAHGGKQIFTEFFGFANRLQNVPFNPSTMFDIGSITKQFTAAAVLKLSEECKLTLNDTLDMYFQGASYDKKLITIHQLLTHSSGLPKGFRLYDVIEPEQLVTQALSSELAFRPGTNYQYSNVGYNLLAIIIEKITGITWETYIAENLLLPAGLTETGYKILNLPADRLAINYGRDPNQFQRFFSLQAASKSVGHSLAHQFKKPGPRWYMEGAGGFLSTISDMHKWYLVLRSNGLLTQASWNKIFTPHIAENPQATSHYGYGWAIDNQMGKKRISHDGSNGYSYAFFRYYPELDAFIFMATNNRDDMPEALIEKFELLIIDSLL